MTPKNQNQALKARGNSSSIKCLIAGSSRLAESLQKGLASMGHNAVCQKKGEDLQLDSFGGAVPDMVVWVQDLPETSNMLSDLSENEWIDLCEGEAKSALYTAAAYFKMSNSGISEGANVSARLVFVVPTIAMAGAEGFCASAGASETVRILAKGLAKQWGRYGIRVYALALSPEHFVGSQEGKKISVKMSLSDPALGSVGSPETDLAAILDLLCQTGAGFLTGSTITADGGVWMAQ